MKKRLFPALLALVLALTMLSVGVFASSDPSGSGSGGGTTGTTTTTTTLETATARVNAFKDKLTEGNGVSAGTIANMVVAITAAESAKDDVTELKKVYTETTELKVLPASWATDLGFLAPFTELTKLEVNGFDALTEIGALATCTKLTYLDISNNPKVTNLNALATCTELVYLDASNCDLTPVKGQKPDGSGEGTINGISAIEKCTKLTFLNLSGNEHLGSTADASAAMGPLYALSKLQALSLANTAITSEDMVPVWAPTQEADKVKTELKMVNVSNNENLTKLTIPAEITTLTTVNADGLTLESLVYPATQDTNITLTNTKLTVTDTNKDEVAALVEILAEKAPDAGLGLTDDQNATLYAVTTGTVTGGTITVDKSIVAAGDTVTITATPSSGYQVGTITVKDSDNGDVTVTSNTFTMPAKNVTVTATFKLAPETINATYKAGGSLIGGKITLSGLTQGHTYICQISRSKTTIEYNGATIDAHNGPDTVAIMFTADSASKDILVLNSGTGEYFVSVWSSTSANPGSLADTTISSLNLTKATAAP